MSSGHGVEDLANAGYESQADVDHEIREQRIAAIMALADRYAIVYLSDDRSVPEEARAALEAELRKVMG